jgi:quercetin dioxygenase-like cupin family protein
MAPLGKRTTKGAEMKNRRIRKVTAAAVAAALAATALLLVVPALATQPRGVTTTTFGIGRFDNIDANTLTDLGRGQQPRFWRARIKTRGASDLYVLQNTISPGGTFGWHSHPGPSLVIIKSGTATFYMADDPTCPPHVLQAGQGFVDDGHDTHVVRNEGSIDLVTVVVSLVPAGFERRIDEPAPANCPNLPQG